MYAYMYITYKNGGTKFHKYPNYMQHTLTVFCFVLFCSISFFKMLIAPKKFKKKKS